MTMPMRHRKRLLMSRRHREWKIRQRTPGPIAARMSSGRECRPTVTRRDEAEVKIVTTERKERRGFASMSPEKQREIASKGGRAAHEKGTAHEWTADEARLAGRKGGQVSRGGRGRLIAPEPTAPPSNEGEIQ
jgi:general stress protein YciG